MRANPDLRLIDTSGAPADEPGPPQETGTPSIVSELEVFVRKEVGLREALQLRLAERERELEELRGTLAESGDVAVRASRLEAAEGAFEERVKELAGREELVE